MFCLPRQLSHPEHELTCLPCLQKHHWCRNRVHCLCSTLLLADCTGRPCGARSDWTCGITQVEGVRAEWDKQADGLKQAALEQVATHEQELQLVVSAQQVRLGEAAQAQARQVQEAAGRYAHR